MLDFQKDWLALYPEIMHLDRTYKTQDERYILFTFLVQVREKKKEIYIIFIEIFKYCFDSG